MGDPNVPIVPPTAPWWIRVPITILDKHGVTTLIALAAIWAGWTTFRVLGERHLKFIDASLIQQELTTRAVEAIEDNTAINSELLRQLNAHMQGENSQRKMEHEKIMDAIERKKF